jgi:hypothetical protein
MGGNRLCRTDPIAHSERILEEAGQIQGQAIALHSWH